jgi:hypothetical protein
MEEYYVYIYLDPRKPGKFIYENLEFDFEPFYVGKGIGNRMFYHLNHSINNSYKLNKISKIKELGLTPIVKKVYDNLSENKAFMKEKELILKIGRMENGPLVNFSDGGEGQSGFKHNNSTKDKISKSVIIAFGNMSERKKEERRKNISKSLIGHEGHIFEHTEESKEKIRKAKIGEKNPFYDKTHSEQLKEKWKIERFGLNNGNSVCYKIKNNDNIFEIKSRDELKEFSKEKNFSFSSILRYNKSKNFIIIEKTKINKK